MLTEYDYVDFGGVTAGARSFSDKVFKGEKGLVISADAKIQAAGLKASLEVRPLDPTDRGSLTGKVRFATVCNLERQPDFASATAIIANAVHVSRSFVYIQMPSFDSDGYLLSNGMKMHWSDWTVHATPMTSLQLLRVVQPMLAKGAVARMAIFGRHAIASSADPRILPLSAPRNSGRYDASIHGAKADLQFPGGVYAQTLAIIARRDVRAVDTIASRIGNLVCLYDSVENAGMVAPQDVAAPAAAHRGAAPQLVAPQRPAAQPGVPTRSRAALAEPAVARSPFQRSQG